MQSLYQIGAKDVYLNQMVTHGVFNNPQRTIIYLETDVVKIPRSWIWYFLVISRHQAILCHDNYQDQLTFIYRQFDKKKQVITH